MTDCGEERSVSLWRGLCGETCSVVPAQKGLNDCTLFTELRLLGDFPTPFFHRCLLLQPNWIIHCSLPNAYMPPHVHTCAHTCTFSTDFFSFCFVLFCFSRVYCPSKCSDNILVGIFPLFSLPFLLPPHPHPWLLKDTQLRSSSTSLIFFASLWGHLAAFSSLELSLDWSAKLSQGFGLFLFWFLRIPGIQ